MIIIWYSTGHSIQGLGLKGLKAGDANGEMLGVLKLFGMLGPGTRQKAA